MKKLLLATSAIVGMAGAAAAEVSVSGDARIGLRYESDVPYIEDCTVGGVWGLCAGERDSWNVISRARVKFTMTGETDTGLSFGANIRADQASGQHNNGNFSMYKGDVWMSGAYGKITAGDIDSAASTAVGHLPEIGVSELNDYNEIYYSTSDYDSEIYRESGIAYEYSFGDATIYASFMDRYVRDTAEKRRGDAWALGGTYNFGNYSVALGYESAGLFIEPVSYTVTAQDVVLTNPGFHDGSLYNNDNKTIALSGTANFQGLTLKAIYAQTNVDGSSNPYSWSLDKYKVRQYGIGAEYEMDNGIGLQGFYRKIDGDGINIGGVDLKNEADIIAIGATYDLGGGATLKGGIAHIKGDSPVVGYDGPNGTRFKHTTADFGVSMKF